MGAACRNQRFQRREYAAVEVFDAGIKGQGLRAVAPIAAYVRRSQNVHGKQRGEQVERETRREVNKARTYSLTHMRSERQIQRDKHSDRNRERNSKKDEEKEKEPRDTQDVDKQRRYHTYTYKEQSVSERSEAKATIGLHG